MQYATFLAVVLALATTGLVQARGKYRGLEFLDTCTKSDPELESCLTRSANTLAENFRTGESTGTKVDGEISFHST